MVSSLRGAELHVGSSSNGAGVVVDEHLLEDGTRIAVETALTQAAIWQQPVFTALAEDIVGVLREIDKHSIYYV